MATRDGDGIGNGRQHDVIIIDAMPEPESGGGVSLQGAVGEGNTSSQPSLFASGAVQTTASTLQASVLVVAPPSPAAAPRQRHDCPPLIAIDDSPSPPRASGTSTVSLQHWRTGHLPFPTAWSRHGSNDFRPAVYTTRNSTTLPGLSHGNSRVDASHNAHNTFHSSSHQVLPPNQIPLTTLGTVDATMAQYPYARNSALPFTSSGQFGSLTGPSPPSDRGAAPKSVVGQSFPHKPSMQLPNWSGSSSMPNLHSGQYLPDNHNARHPEDSFFLSGHHGTNSIVSQQTQGSLTRLPNNPFLTYQDQQDRRAQHHDASQLTGLFPPPSAKPMAANPFNLQQGRREVADLTVDMGNVTDEQVLDILELNSTIAQQFRSACAIRLQQYQQSLDKAYNQRLAEMEDYTRKWREHTRELWEARRAGQLQPADASQQAALDWQGPLKMAKTAQFQLPSINTGLGEPIISIKGQVHSGEVIASFPPPAPPAPASKRKTRPRRKAQPGHCQRRQAVPSPPPSRPSRTDAPPSSRQVGHLLSGVPGQPLYSRHAPAPPAPSQPTPSQPAPVQIGTDQLAFHHESPSRSILSQTVAPQAPQRQLLCPDWIHEFEGCVKGSSGKYTKKSTRFLTVLYSGDLGPSFSSTLKLSYSAILLKVKSDPSKHTYRYFDSLTSIRNRVNPHDVVLDLSEANVLMFGKAFCYMKDRRECLRTELGLTRIGQPRDEGEIVLLYNFFSQQPINKRLNTARNPGDIRGGLALQKLVHETRRLLIARPKHQNGHIKGAAYFDVGSEQPVTRSHSDDAIVLSEDNVTFGRLLAMLKLCLTWHIVVIQDTPQPGNPKRGTAVQDQLSHLEGQASQSQLGPVESQLRWDKWVEVIHGDPDEYIHKFPKTQETSQKLGFPVDRQLWLKSADGEGAVQYYNMESASTVTHPVISGQDIVIHWTASNVLIFWKAFCLLTERMDRLSTVCAQNDGKLSPIESHGRLARYYGDFLKTLDQQTKLHTISSPISRWDRGGKPIFGIMSRGWLVERRLILVRTYCKNKSIDMAATEYFDVGTVSPIDGRPSFPADIVVPENTAIASRIAQLLIASIQMDMFPVLKDLGSPLNPQPEGVIRDSSRSLNESARTSLPVSPTSPTASAAPSIQGATLIKRVLEYSTDLRRFGISVPPKALARQMPSCSPSPSPPQPCSSLPSPSLIAAMPSTGLTISDEDPAVSDGAEIMKQKSNNQDKKVIVFDDSSENGGDNDDDHDCMITDSPPDKASVEARKPPTTDADYEARPAKRIKLDVPGSEGQEVGDEGVVLSSELGWIWNAKKSPEQQACTSTSEDTPGAPTIVHRAATEAPGETIVLPFGNDASINRSKSTSALEDRQAESHMSAGSDPTSELAESSYVTAAEANDEDS